MTDKIERAALALGAWLEGRYGKHRAVGDMEGTVMSYVDINNVDLRDIVKVVLENLEPPPAAFQRQVGEPRS
jgi:hypothetical protein